MKKRLIYLLTLSLSALCALAGDLPFTATLTPYEGKDTDKLGANMVDFEIKNESSEPVNGIVITRNNGKTFSHVYAPPEGLEAIVSSPAYVAGDSGSTKGYVKEYWSCDALRVCNHPEKIFRLLKGDSLPTSGILSPTELAENILYTAQLLPLNGKINTPEWRTVYTSGSFGAFQNSGDQFVSRMHGFMTIKKAGKYRIRLGADDTAMFEITRLDGARLVTNSIVRKTYVSNSDKSYFDPDVMEFSAGEVVYVNAIHVDAGGSDFFKLTYEKANVVSSYLETETNKNAVKAELLVWCVLGGMSSIIPSYPAYDLEDKKISNDLEFQNNKCKWKGIWYEYNTIVSVINEIFEYLDKEHVWGGGYYYISVENASFSFSTEAPESPSMWASLLWPSIKSNIIMAQGGSNRAIRVSNLNLASGDKVNFSAQLQEALNTSEPFNYAPNEVLWNLPSNQGKTTIQVFGAYGGTSTITLGDTMDVKADIPYVFKSDARPVSLKVRCVDADGNDVPQAARFRLKVTDPANDDEVFYEYDTVTSKSTDLSGVRPFVKDSPDSTISHDAKTGLELSPGMQVVFEAVEESYFDENHYFIYNSREGEPVDKSLYKEPVERFVASGISVNNNAQTADATRYAFEIRQSTTIDFRVRQEYALDVSSDFTATKARLTTATGAPWAGPLTSAAAGSPEPAAGADENVRHWIAANSQVVAQIDAEVQDIALSAQQLHTRYVPYEYLATGVACGDVLNTNSAVKPLETPKMTGVRHQINFLMKSHGSIRYRWKLQYGAYVQSPEANLRKVQQFTGNEWVDTDPVGAVYWFDQGANVRILAAAARADNSKSLSNWMLGDGYYFPADGSINSETGEMIGAKIMRDSNNNPVAEWLASADKIVGKYRGLHITDMRRPASVTWGYGKLIFYDPQLQLGEYMLQGRSAKIEKDYPAVAQRMFAAPSYMDPPDGALWDPNAKVLFPVKTGNIKAIYTNETADSGFEVHITASWPVRPHYKHIADSPAVQLTPDPDGAFQFVASLLSTDAVSPVIQNNSEFVASGSGWTLLRFKEIKKAGRAEPKEYVALRTVRTKSWQESYKESGDAASIIGQTISDPLDLAGLGTGYLIHQGKVPFNASIYNSEMLAGLRSSQLYNVAKLKALKPERIIVNSGLLPGPVIPVNEYVTGATDTERIIITWYDDPVYTDGLLWPYASRRYSVRWPATQAEGLGRIVIASEWGSESLGADGYDQTIAFATNDIPVYKTFDPSRFAELKVYSQADPDASGYNPNEEHAMLAPSLRYADVSPRPNAVYALRDGDLNAQAGSGSKPYVLAQFFDNVLNKYGMRVFSIVAEDENIAGHRFARQNLLVAYGASPEVYILEPHKKMEAGEPVIPFYPLGVVEGAVPCPESTGTNLMGQTTFWKDHKNTRWAVSGGIDAWFAVKAFYPLQPDFWWPSSLKNVTMLDGKIVEPQVGASVAFMPPAAASTEPKKVLYKSDWPRIAPMLKAGETLTYSGGEYRADHPTIVVPTADGSGTETIQTPGLPAVTAFAVGEVVFDMLNPKKETDKLLTDWTVRIAQAMASLSVNLPASSYPAILQPANGKTRQYQGKYVFKDLPASLQKRVRYDPITQKLELRGILNGKTTDDATLTASPAAVYTLEPNILTASDAVELIALASDSTEWGKAVNDLRALSLNPAGLDNAKYGSGRYTVGLQPEVQRDKFGIAEMVLDKSTGLYSEKVDKNIAENARAFGVGLAAIPNGKFLDPKSNYPDVSWVTIAENNDPSMGGSPVTLHVIKVDRRERYRGAIKTVLSDNVFDENVVLRHTGDFGANGDELIYEWWYRPDDGALDVPPPYVKDSASAGDWKLFPDLSGKGGMGRNEILLKGDPNAPETLLADSWWFVRYRHKNDVVAGTDWAVKQPDNAPKVNFEWAGGGNNDPFNDFNMDGFPDYMPQLSMGWIKRVLDAVNPYEARIADFTGDAPATGSSMLQQLGPRFEGAVALNPDKNVIENVGLIELYQTILNRASDLSINLSSPVSTPAIANALQLASTRLSDFYMLLGNEAYVDAKDPTIGYGSSSVEYGAAAPVVHAFQNQTASLLEEELDLLRGQDAGMARPVYNRMFWNFTKGEGEAAYAMNYNISDINKDGFIDEYDAMTLYPQGHGDAWGHYLTALTQQYNLLTHPYFNWVSRSEFYNLMDIPMKVDFLDERKFAQIAAQKAKAGAEIVANTYRQYFTEDEAAQWQGYTDVNTDRAWGVQDWARRAGQGAYFDWITANALLPSEHPNETLTGVQKVDRKENSDIRLISANLNAVQTTLDNADNGLNPLGISSKAVPFDINPYSWDDGVYGRTHFEQVFDRAAIALNNAKAAWDNANAAQNRLRAIANTEQEFRNDVYQQDIAYRNELMEIFGRPYPGTVGAGKFYPDGYVGPDMAYYMYVAANNVTEKNFPQPLSSAARFNGADELIGGILFDAVEKSKLLNGGAFLISSGTMKENRDMISVLFGSINNNSEYSKMALAKDGTYDISAYDFSGEGPLKEALNFTLPVTALSYSKQAPTSWGERPIVGELQQIIAEMLQLQIEIATTFNSYQDMFVDAVRAINLLEIQREIDDRIATRNLSVYVVKSVLQSAALIAKTTCEIIEEVKNTTLTFADGVAEAIPGNTPEAGMSFSLGDAMAPLRGTVKLGAATIEAGLGSAGVAAKIIDLVNEVTWNIVDGANDIANNTDERLKSYIEGIAGLDDMLDEEEALRAEIFAKSEQLRSLGERYRSTLSRGAMLIDEREAFNRRAAAMTQQNRYQDMTFRVERNHALQNYNRLLDIAARYTYLAAKAYDYETNLDATDPGSPSALFDEIAKARTIGYVADGVPQIGDGLAGILAHLDANYTVMKNRLGLTNPQIETGKLSLRTENSRILPSEYEVQDGVSADGWKGENGADDNWAQVLEKARVKDLWDVPEFRYLARPFNDSVNADGTPVTEPGIVIRFSTKIKSGYNVFGKPLAGGDHAYDPSVYATRIRSVGVWFSDYLAEDVLMDLSATPRVYLIPTGADIMSIPNAPTPNQVRVWNVVDQVIPVPIPGIDAKLPYSNFMPLLDSLDGRIGQQRRFSSFRAYHDSGTEAVDIDELTTDSRLVGRSVWNTGWTLIIPGRALNADPDVGLDRFIEQVSDIKLVFGTYGFSGN